MAVCRRCARELTGDEIGMTKKMVSRGATEFFCMDCLAEYHRVPVEALYRKLEEFRAMGCTLFAQEKRAEPPASCATARDALQYNHQTKGGV